MKYVLAAWVVLCTALPAHATSVVYRSMKELVHDADVVVQGQVTELEGFWQGMRIYTRARVTVKDVWLGAAPTDAYVDVITLGGVVGTIGQRVDGAAVLPMDQRLVVQLRARELHVGEYVPVAMAQGVWFINGDERDGHALVTRPSADRVVLRPGQVADVMPHTLADLKRAMLEAARAP